MKRILSSAIIAVLVVVIVLAVAKNTIARVSVEKGVETVTGLPLKMKSLNIGLINTLVGIKELKLFNPAGYEDKVMLDVPEIFVDYDLPAIIKGKIHLKEVRINLKEFVVVKNNKGELNLDALKAVQQQKEPEKPEPAKKGKAPELQIDTLELKIGKVVYKDYSKRGEPSIKEFNIGIDEKFQNIDDPNKLVSLIIVKALMNTTVAKLTNFDLKGLQSSIGDTLASAQKIVGQAGETAAKTTQQAQEAAKTTTEAAKKTVESLGGLFGSGKE
ncbi:MAG: hypothetical protein U9R44_00300 [Candidatus Omnitrophota bacterium]|nr:hypothetical protein [Candidatus Omnitrophota bacterium]